jgi:hypothetical protein
LNRGQHPVAAFDIASGTHADHTSVFALRFQREEMVEGGHAVNPAGRKFQAVGNEQQQVVVQITE